MAGVTQFIATKGTYAFPSTTQEFRDNFRDVVSKVVRLPGVDGGFDVYGLSHAPSEVGSVQFSYFLVSRDGSGMQALRDAAAKMRYWGYGRLVLSPNNPNLTRWCWGRFNNIQIGQEFHNHTEYFQKVQLTFQAAEPFWYQTGTERLWGDGGIWNDGGLWGGNAAADSPTSVTTSGTVSATVGGNIFTLPRLLVIKDSAGVAANIKIRRIVGGAIEDEVAWLGELTNGQWLEIDARAHKAFIGPAGTSAFSTLSYLNPDLMRLEVGSNTLQVYLDGTAKVAARWLERYI